jgi:hypothetical protein
MNSLKAMQMASAIGKSNSAGSARRPRDGRHMPSAGTRSLALIAVMLVGVWSLQGCGGGSGGGKTTVTSVTITPTTITVPLNTTTQFTAVVKLSDSSTSTTTTVTWEVNGIANGNLATVGSIVPSTDNQLLGVYTAPGSVPTTATPGVTQVGQVSITAVATQTTTGTTTTSPTVTSNTAIVTVGAGSGLTVTPTSVTVPAGGVHQFSALLNGLTDSNATWTVTPPTDTAIYGSIDSSGVYTAPLSPPPGGTITVTATDPAAIAPATSTVTIVYSDHSLNGPYAFSYTGNDQSGFLAVAGSFVADGNGKILSGVEDVDSFLTGVATQVSLSGTYVVGPDGRVNAKISTGQGPDTWEFALTTSQHGQMTLFDANTTGGGTIDQQSLDAVSNSASVITGHYVFSLLGADAGFNALGMAGKFAADGAGGIAQTKTILDVNDNGISTGTVTTSDTSLHGTYQFDPVFSGTGRGTITIISNTTGSRLYAFYGVDAPANPNGPDFVTRLHLIEIDRKAYVAGDMFSAPAGPSALTAGNYVFTGGGNTMVPVSGKPSVLGAYAAGGVFTSSGSGGISGGVFDDNSGGTYNAGPTINSCSSYATDATTGRIDLKMFTGTGACPALPNSSTSEFAVYQTSQGMALMLEIDSNALSTGTAYQQCVPPAAACSATVSLPGGSFAIGLTGQGIFHNDASLYQPDASGQVTLSTTAITRGSLDINIFSAVSLADPITGTGSSVGAPAANGRATATLATSNPASTFKLIYYLIDDNTALLFDQDATPIATGILARQF